ncbi:MAG: alpha-amylase family protein [Cyclobacteriaceae bacterium]|nr:alpha-amylase family protein [Cyclobacteriaceae bacterium]
MRTIVGLFLITALALWQCAPPAKEKIPPLPEMTDLQSKMVIYQLMVRLFGNTQTTNKTYGTIEENGSGKFNDINDHALRGLRELGATHVWLMGVIEHASSTAYPQHGIEADDPDVVKGRAGSPFSIRDYYDVDPDLAINVADRMREFEELVGRVHAHDLKVIVDFVPNHVARVYRSDAKPEGVEDLGASDDTSKPFAVDNSFYYLPGQSFQPPREHFTLCKSFFPEMDGRFNEVPAKASGDGPFTATPSVDSWFESVKLNYGIDFQDNWKTHFDSIPATWIKMRDILLFWAGKKVDGFRCDMAQMVPVEFWRWVIPQIKAVNVNIIFIAEIYEPSRYRDFITRGRFDFLYDKVQLYDTLRLMVQGKPAAVDVAEIQQSLSDINDRMVHFMENHDEHRIASSFFAGDPLRALPAMVVSATIDQGPVMIYFGQEVGEPAAGSPGFASNDGQTTRFDYWGVPEHQKWVNGKKYDGGQLDDSQKALRTWYGKLLNLTHDEKAITLGEYLDLTAFNVEAKGCSNRIVSFVRFYGDERVIVIAGFNRQTETIRIRLTPEVLSKWKVSDGVKSLRSLLDESPNISMDKTGGLQIDLPPFGVMVFKMV